jgi:hypothetical protein
MSNSATHQSEEGNTTAFAACGNYMTWCPKAKCTDNMIRYIPVTGKVTLKNNDGTVDILYSVDDEAMMKRLSVLHNMIQIMTLAEIARASGKPLEVVAADKKWTTGLRDGLTK